jgi:sugar-phosphatase
MDDLAGIEPIAGARAFLRSLPPDRWGIVTSAPLTLALRRLDAAGLPIPEMLVSGNDVANGKPAPDCFELGARRLGQRPQDCLVFEDAAAGIEAAEAAGAAVLVVDALHKQALETVHPSVPGYAALAARQDAGGLLQIGAHTRSFQHAAVKNDCDATA